MGTFFADARDFHAWRSRINQESDRACVILGGVFLDAMLKHLLECRLLAFQGDLLESMGPLSTFSARIKVARALGWISEDARSDLDRIRGIRNDFAHVANYSLDFGDRSVADRCSSLSSAKTFLNALDRASDALIQKYGTESADAIKAKYSAPRRRYQLTVELLALYLNSLAKGGPPMPGGELLELAAEYGGTLQLADA